MHTERKSIQNDRELEFAIFCVENIAGRTGIDAERIYEALAEKSDIMNGYIVPCYDILHTQGKDYIVDDILGVVQEKGGFTVIVYHGSCVEVSKPDLKHSRKNVDFECGFYTTPLLEQAMKWCRKFKEKQKDAVVSRYIFDESAFETCKVLRFDAYSEEWLDFILKCRRGEDVTDYDIVMGGVANDKVFNTVELFLTA